MKNSLTPPFSPPPHPPTVDFNGEVARKKKVLAFVKSQKLKQCLHLKNDDGGGKGNKF